VSRTSRGLPSPWAALAAATLASSPSCTPEVDSATPADSAADVPRGALSFRWPLADPALFYQTTGVDHDPTVYEEVAYQVICLDYQGRAFPWCYDEHHGSDYLLDGGFDTMDAGSTPIVAAADGVVSAAVDGNYDRCHAAGDGVDCDGHEMVANKVELTHSTGHVTRYLHMESGSVAVAEGDVVHCGDVLGHVGSSGQSSAPHLHFELQDAAGAVIDSYAGPESQPETWWVEQGDAEAFPGMACAPSG
jgi:murein DD-endopeptidase MepM/ murein hydrolase activator NlpD